MVGYDLIKPGKDYSDLIGAIKNVSQDWWHCLDSTWIIKTNNTAEQVRNLLLDHIDGNDGLLVATLSAPGAWAHFSQECSDWLRSNL